MRRKRDRAVAFGDAMPLGSVWSGPLLAAVKAGDITGSGIKKALERMRDHAPAGLEGVCLPTTFTPDNHRGSTTVNLYRNDDSYAGAHAQKVYNTTVVA